MWLWDNWNRPNRGWNWYFMVGWSSFVIAIGFFFMGAGVSPPRRQVCPTSANRQTYGSVVEIRDSYRASGGSAAWSCADNSNSV